MIEVSASASELHMTLQLSHVDNFWADTRDGLTPSRALQKFDACLTPFERREIARYPRVYYAGQRCSAKPPPGRSLLDDAFTNAKGEYVVALHDHIAYRYEITARIGCGAFGQVLRAIDHATNEEVAVKVVNKAPGVSAAAWSEVKVLQHIQKKQGSTHYGIVHLIDGFLFRGHVCLVCELLGPNLYDEMKLRKFYPMALSTVKRLAAQLLVSLAFLWREKIIHCDLKPENILVKDAKKANIRLVDFGSACFEGGRLYTYVQSRYYRAPEVILGLPYGLPVDLWSYGCILCELATGSPLFAGEDEVDQLWRIIACLGLPPDDMLAGSRRRAKFFASSSNNNNNSDNITTTTVDHTKATTGGGAGSSNGGGGGEAVMGASGLNHHNEDNNNHNKRHSSSPCTDGSSRTALAPPPSLLKPHEPASISLAAFLGLPEDDAFVSFVAQFLTWRPQQRSSPRAAMEHVWIRDQFVLSPVPPAPPHVPTTTTATTTTTTTTTTASTNMTHTHTVTTITATSATDTTAGHGSPAVHSTAAMLTPATTTIAAAVPVAAPGSTSATTTTMAARAAMAGTASHGGESAAVAPPPPAALFSNDSTVQRVMQRIAALEAASAGPQTSKAALTNAPPSCEVSVNTDSHSALPAVPPATHADKADDTKHSPYNDNAEDDGVVLVAGDDTVPSTTNATSSSKTTTTTVSETTTATATVGRTANTKARPKRASLDVPPVPPPPPPPVAHIILDATPHVTRGATEAACTKKAAQTSLLTHTAPNNKATAARADVPSTPTAHTAAAMTTNAITATTTATTRTATMATTATPTTALSVTPPAASASDVTASRASPTASPITAAAPRGGSTGQQATLPARPHRRLVVEKTKGSSCLSEDAARTIESTAAAAANGGHGGQSRGGRCSFHENTTGGGGRERAEVRAEMQTPRPAAEQPTSSPAPSSPPPPLQDTKTPHNGSKATMVVPGSKATTTTSNSSHNSLVATAAAAPHTHGSAFDAASHPSSAERPPYCGIPRRATRRRLPSLTAVGVGSSGGGAGVGQSQAVSYRTMNPAPPPTNNNNNSNSNSNSSNRRAVLDDGCESRALRASSTIVPRASTASAAPDASATRRAATSGTSERLPRSPVLRVVGRRARQSHAFVMPNSLFTGGAVVASPPLLAPLAPVPPRRMRM